MIVVTGATGQLGKAVVEGLLRRVPADRIVAGFRNAGKASSLAAQGVEVRVADFAARQSVTEAFAGAEQVLIVSADKLGDEAVRLHRTAIKAARDGSVLPLGRTHLNHLSQFQGPAHRIRAVVNARPVAQP